jgi:hypothetical protein
MNMKMDERSGVPVCQTWFPITAMPRYRKIRQSAVEPIIFMK